MRTDRRGQREARREEGWREVAPLEVMSLKRFMMLTSVCS
jgi:hypothetical protein